MTTAAVGRPEPHVQGEFYARCARQSGQAILAILCQRFLRVAPGASTSREEGWSATGSSKHVQGAD